MPSTRNLRLFGFLPILVAALSVAYAQTGRQVIALQGRLTDSHGGPVSGTRSLTIRLYTVPTGSTHIFDETQPSVLVTDGTYSIEVGAATEGGLPDTVFADPNDDLWIVTPLTAGQERMAKAQTRKQTMRLDNVDCITFQFDSMGYAPFEIWIDGLAVE